MTGHGPTPSEALEQDRAWLDGFRRGDKAALARVFRAYAPAIAQALRAGVVLQVDGQPTRVGARLPEDEIEQLVQETFTKAFQPRARESFDGVRPYAAFLWVVARNCLIDRARRLRRDARVVTLADVDAFESTQAADDPADRIADAQLTAIVNGVRDALEEPEKSIYRLRFEDGLSARETARSLGLTEIVVRRRDTRLRARLLEALRAEGFLADHAVRIGSSLLGRKGSA